MLKAIIFVVLIVNPFSHEAERIKKKYQIEGLPLDVFDHAKRLVEWNTHKGKKKIIPEGLISGYDLERDVLAQRLLFTTIALHFTPYSNELRLVKESIRNLVRARILSSLDPNYDDKIIGLLSDLLDIQVGSPTVYGGMMFGQVSVEKRELYAQAQIRYGEPWKIKYAVNWRELIRIIRARELRFVDLYLVKGLTLLSLNDLIGYYSRLVGLNIEEFINSRFEVFQGKHSADEIKKLTEETAELSRFLSDVSDKTYVSSILQGKAGKLEPEKFPPCIRGIIAGVETGSRNYSISVLLTSFLSYARVAPKKVQNPRISDYIKDPKVLTDEILPMIYEAAARCKPPLFEDQPGEKLNVHYHLGLGLTSQVKLEGSGSSHWYFPPNCEKIKRESPALCKPDETCRNIRNPLTYYFVKNTKKKSDDKEEDHG